MEETKHQTNAPDVKGHGAEAKHDTDVVGDIPRLVVSEYHESYEQHEEKHVGVVPEELEVALGALPVRLFDLVQDSTYRQDVEEVLPRIGRVVNSFLAKIVGEAGCHLHVNGDEDQVRVNVEEKVPPRATEELRRQKAGVRQEFTRTYLRLLRTFFGCWTKSHDIDLSPFAASVKKWLCRGSSPFHICPT